MKWCTQKLAVGGHPRSSERGPEGLKSELGLAFCKLNVKRRMSPNERREFIGGSARILSSEAQERLEVLCSHSGLG